jgi:hypothetical protein
MFIPVSVEFDVELQISLQVSLRVGEDSLTFAELSPLPGGTLVGLRGTYWSLGSCRRIVIVPIAGGSCCSRGGVFDRVAARGCRGFVSLARCYGRGIWR